MLVIHIILFLTTSCSFCGGYNLDTRFPVIYNGSKGSYFGYTAALHKNKWGAVALVGAPKSNTTTFKEKVYQPGTLFRCNITEKGQLPCKEVLLMTEGGKGRDDNYNFAYVDNKKEMWLGVSLDVSPSEESDDIVTCGHLWKNEYHYRLRLHLVNGVCYVINGNFDRSSIKKLLPLTQRGMQSGRDWQGNTEYNHAYGQVGISAVFSEDGSNLYLGAPGIWSWKGSIVSYGLHPGTTQFYYEYPIIPQPSPDVDFNSYFGYSVAPGRYFLPQEKFLAVGAPRDGGNYGRVYVIGFRRNDMQIRTTKEGSQLGEYFGASVLGVDLNGDKFTDLLVGAPLYSHDAGDEGKVYIYLSNGRDLIKDIELVGDRKVNARFGTALANIDDLNQDGFPDIAVGAPYEDDHGAIYIYHGSRTGLKSEYAQKIEASAIHPQLSGFGIHVSRGMDIDDNGYPDILVGSYESSNAVLFRSKPMIYVYSELIFNPKKIRMNQTMCDVGGRNLTCVHVEACLKYTGKYVPEQLDFKLTIVSEDSFNRAFFVKSNRSRPISEINLIANINELFCSTFTPLLLSSKTKDLITPLPVRLHHDLVEPPSYEDTFHKTFPIYHPSSPKELASKIAFHTGCGKENECHSDLMVSAERIYPEKGKSITLGAISRVEIVIKVSNEGEPAYLSQLLIDVPPQMPSINEDFCQDGRLQYNVSFVCGLGNPLLNGSEVKVHIKLDATKIPPNTKYLEVNSRAITLSTEMNPEDNEEKVALHWKTVSDIRITDSESLHQVLYDGVQETSQITTHTYTIRNHGPSPLQKINVAFLVPYYFSSSNNKEKLLIFTGLQTTSSSTLRIPAVCDDSILNIQAPQIASKNDGDISSDDDFFKGDSNSTSDTSQLKNRVGPPSDLTKNSDVEPTVHLTGKINSKSNTTSSRAREHFVIDVMLGEFRQRLLQMESLTSLTTPSYDAIIWPTNCENSIVECVEIRCSAEPFVDVWKFAQISLHFQLNFTTINKHVASWYQIEFETSGRIWTSDSSVLQLQEDTDEIAISTMFLHEGPPPPEELSAQIIFISVGVGIVLLLLILILFIKIGFFRRKEKDKMKELLYDAKKEEAQGDQESVGGNENVQDPANDADATNQ